MRLWIASWFTACLGLCLLGFSTPAGAQTSRPSNIQRFTLPNELRVVLEPLTDRSSTAVCVTYRAGSGLEPEGETGVATLVERLMTQGSRNVGPNEHARLLSERGASTDSLTTEETTSYCSQITSSELPLVFWLEADRMSQLALNKESFERQRALLFDEYRLRVSHDALMRGTSRLHELVFQRYWPYEHPPLGYRQDLLTAQYTQAKAFVSDYYSPDNAVISIVGSFDETSVRAQLEQFFGSLPKTARKPQIPSNPPAELARQTSERLSVLEERSLHAPMVFYGWRIPAAHSRDAHALALAAHVLCNPQTGRLRAELMHTEVLAHDVTCSTYSLRDAGLFRVQVTLHRRSTVDAMQKALEKQLLALKLSGPTLPELERAKALLGAEKVFASEPLLPRSRELGRLEAVHGDATALDREARAFAAITPSDVRAAAAKHLLDTRRSIVELYPHGWVRDIGPPVITKTYIVQPGDNLTRIAARYGTTPEQLAKQNGLALSKRITIGQRLLITTNPSKIVKLLTHTVTKGQTLIAIGKKYGVAAEDIAKANGLTTKKAIRPGQVLRIPPRPKPTTDAKSKTSTVTGQSPQAPKAGSSPQKAAAGKEPTKPAPPAAPKPDKVPAANAPKSKSSNAPGGAAGAAVAPPKPERTYVVKPGDSLSVIAHKFKVSVPALTRANGISQKKPIRPGQKLVIPQ